MRRHSPPRGIRQQSPPRRRGRVRSLSSLSRNQPAPPGEERGRKSNPWDGPGNRNKRFRSRSREWMERPREPVDREPPFIRDEGRPRGREPPRDKGPKLLEKSRDRNRERDRPMHLPKDGDLLKDGKQKHHHRRGSIDRMLGPDEFEESYLDQQPNLFRNGGMPKNHDNLILDPSIITFNQFVPPESRSDHHKPPEKSRDIPRDQLHPPSRDQRDLPRLSPRDHHPPLRDGRRPPPPPSMRGEHNPNRGSSGGPPGNKRNRNEKDELAAERINRLEKLVEKLVEGNTSGTGKSSEFSFQGPKELIPELIPSNSKFTTSMWLNCIHEESLNRNFDEKSSIRFLQDKMTGVMKAWFKSVSNYDFTWPELKLLITKTFPDNLEFVHTLKLLVARDKLSEETITQYFFSKVYLCEACKVTGENAVSCLVDGLNNPFMKQDIKACNFLTPEALYSEYLSKYPENDGPVRVDRREVREVIPDYSQEEFIPLEMDLREGDHRSAKGMLQHPGDRFDDRPSMGRPPDRVKCFTCKKFGHVTVDCRHAPICYICKKKGHIAAKCHYNKSLLILSSKASSHIVPEMMCFLNKQQYYGIIDTGSVAVTLKKQVIQDLRLKVSPSKEVLKGYGGSLIVPLGETKVLLAVGSAQRHVTALVIEDNLQDVPVIIGQEFLSQEGVVLCQNNRQVNISDTKSLLV